MIKGYEKWEAHLREVLKFPFEAEIIEYQEHGVFEQGDRLTVKGIDSTNDLYGILVHVNKKKNQYVFPLCDLEVENKKSMNYLPVSDYSYWFANFR